MLTESLGTNEPRGANTFIPGAKKLIPEFTVFSIGLLYLSLVCLLLNCLISGKYKNIYVWGLHCSWLYIFALNIQRFLFQRNKQTLSITTAWELSLLKLHKITPLKTFNNSKAWESCSNRVLWNLLKSSNQKILAILEFSFKMARVKNLRIRLELEVIEPFLCTVTE